MPATKYRQYYQLMIEQNQPLFAEFRTIHDAYRQDMKKHAKSFHTKGQVVVDLIRDWERKLCSGMERGANNVFSSKLSEKFWGLVKDELPWIERVGVRSNLEG